MEKFESVKNCPKCNGNLFTPIDKLFTGKRKYVPGTADIPEHLIVTCSDCGYTWTEECADGTK